MYVRISFLTAWIRAPVQQFPCAVKTTNMLFYSCFSASVDFELTVYCLLVAAKYPCPDLMDAVGPPREPEMRLKDSKPSGRVHLWCGESHVKDGRRPAKLSGRLLVERGHVRAYDDTGWKGDYWRRGVGTDCTRRPLNAYSSNTGATLYRMR